MPVKHDGVALDFSWAGVSIPVVHRRFVQLSERLGIQDVQFIRTWGWSQGLIVSEELKQALEAERISGTRFVEV